MITVKTLSYHWMYLVSKENIHNEQLEIHSLVDVIDNGKSTISELWKQLYDFNKEKPKREEITKE